MRTAIYTAIAGNYDTLKDPVSVTPGFDYICFTDQPLKSKVWQIEPLCCEDRQRAHKQHKIMLTDVEEYDASIWVDGSIQIRGWLDGVVSRLFACDEIGFCIHPWRCCLYQEAEFCLKKEVGQSRLIRSQIARYKKLNFPPNQGLYCGGVIVRRHVPSVLGFNFSWWTELLYSSERDQLSLPYVIRQTGIEVGLLTDSSKQPIQPYDGNPYFRWSGHRK